jgi:hypothetical protein
MTSAQHHPHPQPRRYRLSQYLGTAMMLALCLAAPLQIILALATGGALFLLTAPLSLLMLLPLALLTHATPPVSVDEAGITLRPALGRARFVPWESVRAVRPYPLLPPEDAETVRRAMVGRKKYQAAAGVMLIVPALPLPYRAVGFFAGEGLTPAFALTNRTHIDYDSLVARVTRHFSD